MTIPAIFILAVGFILGLTLAVIIGLVYNNLTKEEWKAPESHL